MTFYEERLGKDLANIHSAVQELGGQVVQALQDSVRALIKEDYGLANQVILGDNVINRGSRALDRLCHAFVVRHLPSAGPLRFVSSVLRISVALERMGDYAVTVARESFQMSSAPPDAVRRDIELIAHQSWRMLEDSLTAFSRGDVDLAHTTMGVDYQIEVTYHKIFEDLLAAGKTDTWPVRDMFAMLGVIASVGRVGDQAKNICEETVFAETGETKEPKVFRVLFVDERNDCLSQLAEAYARKAFPNSGVYTSAGWEEPQELSKGLLAFMDEHALDVRSAKPERLRAEVRELADYHVVVSLGIDPFKRLERTPYRTIVLHWDVPPCPADFEKEKDRQQLIECYRDLTVRVGTLMQQLRGIGAD